MRKYSPSVKFNNELKDKIEGELKALVYRLEKRIMKKLKTAMEQ